MSSVTLSSTETPLKPQFTKADVAALSRAEIARLTSAEMLRVIAVADLPFARNRELVFQSPDTLRQITHLACLSCRNQGY
jgi:hypothetical protein